MHKYIQYSDHSTLCIKYCTLTYDMCFLHLSIYFSLCMQNLTDNNAIIVQNVNEIKNFWKATMHMQSINYDKNVLLAVCNNFAVVRTINRSLMALILLIITLLVYINYTYLRTMQHMLM